MTVILQPLIAVVVVAVAVVAAAAAGRIINETNFRSSYTVCCPSSPLPLKDFRPRTSNVRAGDFFFILVFFSIFSAFYFAYFGLSGSHMIIFLFVGSIQHSIQFN